MNSGGRGKTSHFLMSINPLFVSAVGFSIIINCLKFPNYIFGGAMWAEMGTNYFANSVSPGISSKFFATDAGYIPYPVRWLSTAFSILNAPSNAIPFIYTGAAILIASTLVSLFALKIFRDVIQSDLLRFLVSLTVSICIDFETRTYINFPYISAFILMACLLLLIQDKLPRYLLMLFPIFICAKPLLMAFIPLYIFSYLKVKRKRELLEKVTFYSVGVLTLLQVATILNSRSEGILKQNLNPSLIESITVTFGYFFGVIAQPFNSIFHFGPAVQILIGFIFLLSLIFFLINNESSLRHKFIAIFSTIFLMCLINSLALPDAFNRNYALLQNNFSIFRYTVPIIACLILALGILFDVAQKSIFKNNPLKLALNSFLVFAFILFGSTVFVNIKEPISPTLFNSKWVTYANKIDDGTPVCVPIDPAGWTFERGCRNLTPTVNWTTIAGYSESVLISPEIVFRIKIPESIQRNKVESFGIFVRPLSQKTGFVKLDLKIDFPESGKKIVSIYPLIHSSGGQVIFALPPEVKSLLGARIEITSDQTLSLGVLRTDAREPAVLIYGF